jgi:hypothetical protein
VSIANKQASYILHVARLVYTQGIIEQASAVANKQ